MTYRNPVIPGLHPSPSVHLSTGTGGFPGHTVGMYAVDGDAAFDWFDYEET